MNEKLTFLTFSTPLLNKNKSHLGKKIPLKLVASYKRLKKDIFWVKLRAYLTEGR